MCVFLVFTQRIHNENDDPRCNCPNETYVIGLSATPQATGYQLTVTHNLYTTSQKFKPQCQ